MFVFFTSKLCQNWFVRENAQLTAIKYWTLSKKSSFNWKTQTFVQSEAFCAAVPNDYGRIFASTFCFRLWQEHSMKPFLRSLSTRSLSSTGSLSARFLQASMRTSTWFILLRLWFYPINNIHRSLTIKNKTESNNFHTPKCNDCT